jgi:hypothetical protein
MASVAAPTLPGSTRMSLIQPHGNLEYMGTEPAARVARGRGQIRQAIALLRAAARIVDDLGPSDAVTVAALFAEAERVAAAATVRAARRVGDDGARRHAGRRDAATLLSDVRGSSVGKARAGIEVAERIEASAVVEQAFRNGELSLDQAAVIAPAAVTIPDRAGSLVEAAKGSSLRALRAEAERALRQARSEEDEVGRERRVHARRFCRVSMPDGGGVRIEALLTSARGATVAAALDKELDSVFAEAWAAGASEPRDRLCADALVRLVTGNAKTAGAHVAVRVDAGALVRGRVEDGEVCEIPGVGPVSVTAARSLLGDGFLTMLVTDGVDIKTVTSTTRAIPRRVAVALAERDQTCVVPGCGATRNLEIDHWRLDFARHGPTELDNLCRLCRIHHAMKTKHGWRLGGGPGKWRWEPPPARC